MGSLLDLSLKSTSILLARFIAGPHSGNLKKVAKMRRFVRKMLPASLITAILKGLIPGQVVSLCLFQVVASRKVNLRGEGVHYGVRVKLVAS